MRPRTADEEFLLSKRQYEHMTGRRQEHNVIAYQIRQSFKPGEVTPEEANRIGHELGLRFTKGKHAFIVATHTDRAHIHNHIIFNSTALDCTRKFRDFFLSGLALQRVSDRLCLGTGFPSSRQSPTGNEKSGRNTQREPATGMKYGLPLTRLCGKKPRDFDELVSFLVDTGCKAQTRQTPRSLERGTGAVCPVQFSG